MPSLLERFLNRALEGVATTPEAQDLVRRLISRLLLVLRWLSRLCAWGHLLSILGLWLAFRYVGEQNLSLAFALYLPPAGWALPALIVMPMALLFDWKSLLPAFAAVVLVAVGIMGWVWHPVQQAASGHPTLTVLTFNRGESVGSLQPFKNAMKPDVILLQDATARADRYVKSPGYEEFEYGDSIAQFTIVSRFPVTEKELIMDDGKAYAARFKIDWQGRPIVIYNLHLPTPRAPLRALYRGAFIWGLPGPWAAKRQAYQGWWNEQISHAETILRSAEAEAETLPCLVVGDSNAPAPGYIHHLYTRHLTDTHEAAGHGCGMSFPGVTRNPLSLGGPWMRIDKIFCNSAWRPLWNQAEPDRPSQHRAVAAGLELLK